VNGRRWLAAGVVLAWIVIVGAPPLPDRVDLIVGLACQAFAIALNLAVLLWPARATQPAHAPVMAPALGPLLRETR